MDNSLWTEEVLNRLLTWGISAGLGLLSLAYTFLKWRTERQLRGEELALQQAELATQEDERHALQANLNAEAQGIVNEWVKKQEDRIEVLEGERAELIQVVRRLSGDKRELEQVKRFQEYLRSMRQALIRSESQRQVLSQRLRPTQLDDE